jgi:hypothetical protein
MKIKPFGLPKCTKSYCTKKTKECELKKIRMYMPCSRQYAEGCKKRENFPCGIKSNPVALPEIFCTAYNY